MTASDILEQLMLTPCFQGKTPVIRATWDRGKNPVVLVSGENGSGKSYIRKIVNHICDKNNLPFLGLSMQARQLSSVGRVMLYGDESCQATGLNSVRAVLHTLNVSRSLRHRHLDHVVFLDEPDCGLSDNAALGLGRHLYYWLKRLKFAVRAVFIVTHRKELGKRIALLKPHHLRLDGSPPLRKWLKKVPRPIMPRDLLRTSQEKHRRMSELPPLS